VEAGVTTRFPSVSALGDPAGLRARLAELDCDLPCDDEILPPSESPLAQSLGLRLASGSTRVVGNRFVIQPMEGWDATESGEPSELTRRRWQRFGSSGAGWIWGGEAVAVRADGRANPHQLLLTETTASAIGSLRRELLAASSCGPENRPLVGLQLTHSGRWSRPTTAGPAPRIAFRHPLLDRRVGVTSDDAVLTDAELGALPRDYARAAALAHAEGFDFVDVKCCHGYLLHELLAARSRAGPYGGPSLANRTRLLFEILDAVEDAVPELTIGVRLSVFDSVPYRPKCGWSGSGLAPGEAEPHSTPYDLGFGVDHDEPEQTDLTEPVALVRRLVERGVTWINVTAGSPYTVPHLQRPAAFPPSDGYAPPEDPLIGVARLLGAARDIKWQVPNAAVVSSGWTYLQDFVPHVAQACLGYGWFDAVGLGRMALSYPELPADLLAGKSLDRGRICRTFSDCTTAPRSGLVSGCYPLDDFFRRRPERSTLEQIKREMRRGTSP
jgi:2,4-dienoyl-CoA reductase-like NADH-dependent reductase (Old Yellow Enzyme family)